MSTARRLDREEAARVLDGARPIPAREGASPIPLVEFTGADHAGRSRRIVPKDLDRPLLLVFVTASCDGCRALVTTEALEVMGCAGAVSVLLIWRSEDAQEFAAIDEMSTDADLLVSDGAWRDYQVTGAPFFSLLDPRSAHVLTEGVAFGASGVADLVRRALDGQPTVDAVRLTVSQDEDAPRAN